MNGGVALVRFEGEGSSTLDIVPLEGGTFSVQLIPQISALLLKYDVSPENWIPPPELL